MYETNPGELGNRLWFELARGSTLTTVPVIGSQQENVLTGEHAQQSSAFSSSSGGRYVHF